MVTPPPADELFFALQTALAGEYSLVRELGRGGMGIALIHAHSVLAHELHPTH